jgi:chemotaxis protein methyltransferase CheR
MEISATDNSYNTPISGIMSDKTYRLFSSYVQDTLGIKMPDNKKTMLQSRLLKRMRQLRIQTFEEYYDYVFSPEGIENELHNMLDVVTTNKTDFLREPKHFDYLLHTALPKLSEIRHIGPKNPLLVWSAGCSSGEEPYTLAMLLSDLAAQSRGFHYSILATDICTEVLKKAATGIYTESDVEPVPLALKKKYLLRSKDKSKGKVRMIPELRSAIRFRRLNFMDTNFGLRYARDIIFCRNVIIYFDRPTQETLINMFCKYLIPGGYLFLGHSETINGLQVPLVQVAPTIYRKPL